MFDDMRLGNRDFVSQLDDLAVPLDWDGPEFDRFLNELTELWATELGISNPVASKSTPDPVAVLKERMLALSHCQARVFEAIAGVADAYDTESDGGLDQDVGLVFEAASAEIRAALRLTRRAADRQLDLALTLTQRLPAVLTALKTGVIDTPRAIVIADATIHLSHDTARTVTDQILTEAARLTTGQLRHRLARLCIEVDPDAAAERYVHANSERRVVMEATDAATANLHLTDIAPNLAAAARRNIDRIARTLRHPDETRNIDQLRADVAIDLLRGATTTSQPGATSSRQSTINLTVDLTTLIGLNNNPAELAGFGPVIADIARQTLTNNPDATWQYTLTDPDSQRPIASGITRRRPTTAQHRSITSQNPSCIFPGCRMPATDSDIDHRQPHAQFGPTIVDNLAPLCRHDHRLKHDHGWQHQPLPNGNHQWTSPLGNTYTTTGQSP